jgi:hypothetical protein
MHGGKLRRGRMFRAWKFDLFESLCHIFCSQIMWQIAQSVSLDDLLDYRNWSFTQNVTLRRNWKVSGMNWGWGERRNQLDIEELWTVAKHEKRSEIGSIACRRICQLALTKHENLLSVGDSNHVSSFMELATMNVNNLSERAIDY